MATVIKLKFTTGPTPAMSIFPVVIFICIMLKSA